MDLSDACNKHHDFIITQHDSMHIENVAPHYCTMCHERLYASISDGKYTWFPEWRAVSSSLGFILICGSCSIKYSNEQVYKQVESQGWATISNSNVRTARRYLVKLIASENVLAPDSGWQNWRISI